MISIKISFSPALFLNNVLPEITSNRTIIIPAITKAVNLTFNMFL